MLAARNVPGIRCFHFDEIGVPSPDIMGRDYGGPDEWQAWATAKWLRQLDALPDAVRVAILDAQTLWLELWRANATAPGTRVQLRTQHVGVTPPATCL